MTAPPLAPPRAPTSPPPDSVTLASLLEQLAAGQPLDTAQTETWHALTARNRREWFLVQLRHPALFRHGAYADEEPT